MKALKMKKERHSIWLSMIAYLHKTIEEAPSLPRDVVNKKTRKLLLLIFFLSLSLCSTTLFSGCCRDTSLSHSVYHSHSSCHHSAYVQPLERDLAAIVPMSSTLREREKIGDCQLSHVLSIHYSLWSLKLATLFSVTGSQSIDEYKK